MESEALLWLQVVNVLCTTANAIVAAVLLHLRYSADKVAQMRHYELQLALGQQQRKLEEVANGTAKPAAGLDQTKGPLER